MSKNWEINMIWELYGNPWAVVKAQNRVGINGT